LVKEVLGAIHVSIFRVDQNTAIAICRYPDRVGTQLLSNSFTIAADSSNDVDKYQML
jgi:hypothetical protein